MNYKNNEYLIDGIALFEIPSYSGMKSHQNLERVGLMTLFYKITVFTFLFPFLVGLWNYKRLNKTQLIFLGIETYVMLFMSLETYYSFQKMNNHFLMNIDIVTTTLLMLGYFYWAASKQMKRIIVLFVVSFLFFSIWNFWKDSIWLMNQSVSLVYRCILLLTALLILYETYRLSSAPIHLNSIFWVCTGSTIYCIGTLLLSAFIDSIMKLPREEFLKIWSINWVAAIIRNVLFSISFLTQNK